MSDARAARIVTAFTLWVSQDDVVQELLFGPLNRYGAISSGEVFGDVAEGGYFVVSDLARAVGAVRAEGRGRARPRRRV